MLLLPLSSAGSMSSQEWLLRATGVHLTTSEEKLKLMDQLTAEELLQQKVFHLLLQEHRVAVHLISLQGKHIPRRRAGMQCSELIKEALEENK